MTARKLIDNPVKLVEVFEKMEEFNRLRKLHRKRKHVMDEVDEMLERWQVCKGWMDCDYCGIRIEKYEAWLVETQWRDRIVCESCKDMLLRENEECQK